MKRRVIITLLLLSSVGLLMSDMNFGVGLDFPGTHEFSEAIESMSTKTSFDSNMGLEIFSEYFAPLIKTSSINFEGGFGAAYFLPRGVKFGVDMIGDPVAGYPTVSFIPLYLLGQITANAQDKMSFFGKAKFGYDVLLANEEYLGGVDQTGGLFLGFGGGVILTNNVFIELSYQMLHESLELKSCYSEENPIDVTQSNLSILVGLRMK